MTKMLCRLLIVLMAWMPFQIAHAGIIGTDQVVGSVSQADRAAVLNLVNRADVSSQLQALGIDPATAKDRVAAMTDEEVRSLNGQIAAVPAGADGSGLLILILIGVLIWYFAFR
jgi:hypothetical protein